MSSSHSSDDWQELAGRANDGLEVSLLWSRSSGRLKVEVADAKLGDQFEFEVADADGLSAFYHPFAYASGHGRCLGDAIRASLDVQPQNLVAERSAD
jgi:hypothetical protein